MGFAKLVLNVGRSLTPAVLLVIGCGPGLEPSGGNEGDGETSDPSEGAEAGGEPAVTTTGAGDDVGRGTDDTGSTSSGPVASAGFIDDPDGGNVAYECSLWDQTCPPGEKCNTWANDGGNAWNATKCVPIDPDPDDVGEPCTVVGSGVSGVDSCVLGAMCWNVDPETNEGECVAFCQGSESNPTCPDPDTICNGGRDFALCVSSCCPLEQDCAEDLACLPVHNGFQCFPDASGEDGSFGDPCEYINACDPGLFCANAEMVPGCSGAQGCCTHFCPVGSNVCAGLDSAMDCVPFFEPGAGPPGFENVGACVLPE